MSSVCQRLRLAITLLWISVSVIDSTDSRLNPTILSQFHYEDAHHSGRTLAIKSAQTARFTSDSPSASPSMAPSKLVQGQGSLLSSNIPSLQPSAVISSGLLQASDLPSYLPSLVPSSPKISDLPSISPSSLPSAVADASLSSDIPSLVPSVTPSVISSDLPNVVQSDSPSLIPSEGPSYTPSVATHLIKTQRPTLQQTHRVIKPTLRPIVQPTERPSVLSLPAALESDSPSFVPSTLPSKLSEGQNAQSNVPSLSPSTVSANPSKSPPIASPTARPSSSPTTLPSNEPSNPPTNVPIVSSSPSSTQTIYSALSSFKFTGVTSTMDNATTQIFQTTAMVFFGQRVIQPEGFNCTVVAVNVISQSVVGAGKSRRRQRDLQEKFLVVTFRVVADVVPGDVENFSFQNVVDTTFNTYSYDFQYRLQAASSFFTGRSPCAANSLSEGRTSGATNQHYRYNRISDPSCWKMATAAALTTMMLAAGTTSWLVAG